MVYEGLLFFEDVEIVLDDLFEICIFIFMNVGNLEEVFWLLVIFNDGVGLVWLEFVIVNYIGVYFLVLLNFDEVMDEVEKVKIVKLIMGYEIKVDFFIDCLVYGMGMIVVVFYLKFVILWMSDFKSNEYVNLLGGKQFELDEENLMIGWWGVFCYYYFKYWDVFGLECVVLKWVRD